MLHLVLDGLDVPLPLGEQLVELVPLLGAERSVHGGGHVDDPVVLGQLSSHQLRLDDVNEEFLHLLLVNLYTALDLLECDLAPVELNKFINVDKFKPLALRRSHLFSASCIKERSFIFLRLSSCFRPSPFTKPWLAS